MLQVCWERDRSCYAYINCPLFYMEGILYFEVILEELFFLEFILQVCLCWVPGLTV